MEGNRIGGNAGDGLQVSGHGNTATNIAASGDGTYDLVDTNGFESRDCDSGYTYVYGVGNYVFTA